MSYIGNQPADKILTGLDVADGSIANAELSAQYLNDLTAVTFDHGVDYVAVADGTDSGNKKKALVSSAKIQPFSATLAANAITFGLAPTTMDFRNSDVTIGIPNTRTNASTISLVVPSGATLGTINGQTATLIVLALDVSGTLELAVVNLAGGVSLGESGLISTTAISAAASANNVIYSTTARTNVPYRIVGKVDSTQATAGTWVTAFSSVVGAGTNALQMFGGFGYGQTLQNVTGSRAEGVTYYNNTPKPIVVYISGSTSGAFNFAYTINGIGFSATGISSGSIANGFNFVVPVAGSYLVNHAGSGTLTIWVELR